MGYKHPKLDGMRFGKLLVIKRSHKNKSHQWIWECLCDCGKTTFVPTGKLTNGNTKSCGCSHFIKGRGLKDLTGQRFGKLTVIREHSKRDKNNRIQWECICDCGEELVVLSNRLMTGTKKCCNNCRQPYRAYGNLFGQTHGRSKDRIYVIYYNMLQRCYNIKSKEYKNYGGRGIIVCDRWIESFENFYEDMGDALNGMSIDRIDTNGNYSPDNCRWATANEQMRNIRTNFEWQIDGEKTCMSKLCEEWGLERGRIQYRYDIGWAVACCLFIPSVLYSKKSDQKHISDFAKNKKRLNSMRY